MTEDAKQGERIAKVMARSGVASRRDAERMILEGRVKVNGKPVASPALDVLPSDKVTLDGQAIDAPQPARLWLYYKPLGLVTTEKDEKGRQTVFDTLPDGLPRVMSVGRLDLNSEGLLLLTNDGELKRRLELPSTGWLRKYRVRINGRPNELTFDPLRRGVTIEGEEFLPMDITLDKQQGANAWLTVGLREGKNREIRRAMSEVNLIVNRLIRVSYGPFRLNQMKPGEVIEVKRRVLREQLGPLFEGLAGTEDDKAERPARGRDGAARRGDDSGPRKDRGPRKDGGPRKSFGGDDTRRDDAGRDGAPRKPRFERDAERGDKPFRPKPRPLAEDAGAGERPERKPRWSRAEGDAPRKPRFDRDTGEGSGSGDRAKRAPYAKGPREGAGDKPWGDRSERKPRAPYSKGPRDDDKGGSGWKPRGERAGGEGRGEGAARPWQKSDRPQGGPGKPGSKPRFEGKPRPEGKPRTDGKPYGGPRKPWSDGPRPEGDRPDRGARPASGKPSDGKYKPRSDRPRSDGPRSDKPRSDGPRSDGPRGNFGKPRPDRGDGAPRPRGDGPKRGPKKPS